MRATYLLDPRECTEASIFTPPFYSDLIDVLRCVARLDTFPVVNTKRIYCTIMNNDTFQARVEVNYPLFDWRDIWKNIFNLYIELDSRVILYKYVHEVLATNERLYMLSISTENRCLNCGELDNNMHLFYFCSLAKNLVKWFKTLFFKLWKVKTQNFVQILILDFQPFTLKDRNTGTVLLAEYITGIWFGKKVGILVDDPRLISFIKSRIFKSRWILSKMLKDSFEHHFTKEYILMN